MNSETNPCLTIEIPVHKFFVLDDSPLRLEIFRRHFNSQGIVVVTASTAQDAITILSSQDFELICLDHDLGGKPPEYYGQDCDPVHPNTGSEVCRWMVQNPKPYKVLIHTRNPIGASSMRAILEAINGIEIKDAPFDQLTSLWGLGTAW